MDQALIDEAAQVFGLSNLVPLRAGGQKYVAKASRAGTTVVLKLVALTGSHPTVALERARREVGLLAAIDHSNVVKVVSGLEEIGGAPPAAGAWLEEALDGEDLRDRFTTSWQWDDAARLALHLARGTGAMHKESVVHRDLSPANVRCCADGSFKVMDPGYARHLCRTTLTGIWDPGTPGYLSPEHVSPGVHPIPASDVFQIGILVHQALTGDLPFEVGADMASYVNRLKTSKAPPLQTARPDLTAEQCALVDRCLHKQSARRYLDGLELASALEAPP